METITFPGIGFDINVNRVLISIGGFEIYWYSILITLGLLGAVLFAWFHAKKLGVDRDNLLDCAIVGIIGGIVGARLFYILFSSDLKYYLEDPVRIIRIRDGGLAIYGGVIGGLGLGALVAKIRKTKILPVLDLAAMGFLIGQAVGRWGNFFNQEAFGTNTDAPWGMLLSKERQQALYFEMSGIPGFSLAEPVHPCFLYESLWCLLGFGLLFLVMKKFRKFDGQLLFMYMGWYGLGRVFIEGLRTDSLMLTENIRVSQFLSGLLIAASAALLIIGFVRAKNKKKDEGEYTPVYAEAAGIMMEETVSGETTEESKETDTETEETDENEEDSEE